MTRTLVVTNDFPPRKGGIEAFVFALCKEMAADGVVVYTARMAGSRHVDAQVGYPVIRDSTRVLLPTPRVGRAVRRVAREHGCTDVVFGAAAPLGLLARGLRRDGVQHITGLTHGHEVWWAKMPVARRLLRRLGDDVDVLTYVSEHCRRQISPALSPVAAARMRRLAPTVDPAVFRPGLDGGSERRSWGIATDRPVVLSASRLVRRKGQDRLIDAWPSVLRRHPQAVLVVVGSGPSRRRLRRKIRRCGLGASVVMTPAVAWAAMPTVYAAADVFALPCRTRMWGLEPEAFGIVFLEAAASGLPVVAGDSGGAPEAAAAAAVKRVVDPRSAPAIADAVIAMLDHAAAEQADAAAP